MPTGGRNEPINHWLGSRAGDLPAPDYKVNPPDKLLVTAPKIKELDKTGGVVRADGKIALNLVGDVSVAGLTPGQISEKLIQLAGKYYQKDSLDISVTVTEFKSKVYYVFGQVLAPGIKPYTGRDTVLRVLAGAKLNRDAWPQRVIIVRPDEDTNTKHRVTVDLKAMYETGSAAQDFLLEEGDIVYVPPSPLAELGTTFTRLVFPIMPVANLALLGAGL